MEFSQIKNEASKKSFTITTSRLVIENMGMTYSKGEYSVGTFAHSDIVLEFVSWIYNLSNKNVKNYDKEKNIFFIRHSF